MNIVAKIVIGVLVIGNISILSIGIKERIVCFNTLCWVVANIITLFIGIMANLTIYYDLNGCKNCQPRFDLSKKCLIISLVLIIFIFNFLNLTYCASFLLNLNYPSNISIIIIILLPLAILFITFLITIFIILHIGNIDYSSPAKFDNV